MATFDIPKFGRKNLDMVRESLDTDFRDPCLGFRDHIWDVQTFAAHGAIHVQTFQTQTLGANMQFGSTSGCGAALKLWT